VLVCKRVVADDRTAAAKLAGQEYSELTNSARLISSAPGIGTNRQLGIFRNSVARFLLGQ